MAQTPPSAFTNSSGRGFMANNEPPNTITKTTRSDSGVAEALDLLHVSDAAQDLRGFTGNERSPRKQRARSKHSSKHPDNTPSSTRKPSVSSARSSSHSARARKSREQRPLRTQSSPHGVRPQDNIEDAIAFHERSCQLMQTMNELHHRTASPMTYGPRVVLADIACPEKTEFHTVAVTDDTQWTSDATRRQEYAAIDKRNSGLRRLLRRFMPLCISGPDMVGFYDEADGSDTGSVRRYRLRLDGEKV